jgi:predicted aspartyl protease
MKIVFPYEERHSPLFHKIKRPIIEVYFWSKLINDWLRYKMIADTGADYTVLPKYYAVDLGIDLNKDCVKKKTIGVGGDEIIYFLKNKTEIKISDKKIKIPVGFLNSDSIPPLLGREGCLNMLKVLFANFNTTIES